MDTESTFRGLLEPYTKRTVQEALQFLSFATVGSRKIPLPSPISRLVTAILSRRAYLLGQPSHQLYTLAGELGL
ncbi:hypothetical protein NPIL_113451 [Nephila pilipes]|uniref:Uncharacterized protein n=1 Tax=Nephila pilipes TaxID=299642 RepID=A0A8X6TE44_NEPPI|nr:hypothetical protein NPIL_113451 [Nephila pilipes]